MLHKSDATVCGWGTVRNADHEDYRLENAGYSENLHCMFLNLRNSTVCRTAIPGGDYRNKLICGEAKLTGQITTLVITFQNLRIHIIFLKIFYSKQL